MPYILIFGCRTLVATEPPIWVLCALFWIYYLPFIGQMPANNSIYSKVRQASVFDIQFITKHTYPSLSSQLVGDANISTYFSILEVTKTLGRASAGYLIGASYDTVGPCVLWCGTTSLCAELCHTSLQNILWNHPTHGLPQVYVPWNLVGSICTVFLRLGPTECGC